MAREYKLGDDLSYVKDESKVKRLIKNVLGYFFISIAFAVVSYILIAIFFTTDAEKRLREEAKLIEKVYPTLEEKLDVLESGLDVILEKDNDVYRQMFGTESPDLNFFSQSTHVSVAGLDTLAGADDMVHYTSLALKALKAPSAKIENNLLQAMKMIQGASALPPMSLPVKNFTFAKTGSSVGPKVSPYYGVPITHTGLDIVGVVGEGVYAVDEGVVLDVKMSKSGQGNTVTLQHPSGYTTFYAHLNEVMVKKGRTVKKGQQIATIGMSGASTAPHLHYEVHFKGKTLDPTSYFFGDLTDENYAKVYTTSFLTNLTLD